MGQQWHRLHVFLFLEIKLNSLTYKNNRSTGKDVAMLAGVATATVSRVFNKSPRVSDEVRLKVLEVAKTLNYKPLSAGRMLVRQMQETIGLLCQGDEEGTFYGPGVLDGVSKQIQKYRLHLSISMLPKDSGMDAFEELPFVNSHVIDGLIVDMCNFNGDLDAAIARCQVPYIYVNPNIAKPYNSVLPDDFETAQKATEYLIANGHRNIGYLPSVELGKHHYSSDYRAQGYISVISKSGLNAVPGWDQPITTAFKDDSGKENGEYAQRAKLFISSGCTAIIAYNTMQAVRMVQFFGELGVRVPHQVSIVACDYEPFAAVSMRYPITSFYVKRKRIGEKAVEMLIERLKNSNVDLRSVQIACDFREGLSVRAISIAN